MVIGRLVLWSNEFYWIISIESHKEIYVFIKVIKSVNNKTAMEMNINELLLQSSAFIYRMDGLKFSDSTNWWILNYISN